MIKFLTGEDQLMFLLSVFGEAGGVFNIISISLAKPKRVKLQLPKPDLSKELTSVRLAEMLTCPVCYWCFSTSLGK